MAGLTLARGSKPFRPTAPRRRIAPRRARPPAGTNDSRPIF